MIHNPRFPKDRTKAAALSKEQFAIVNAYIVGCMNAGKPMSERVVLRSLEDAGMPLRFSGPVTADAWLVKDCPNFYFAPSQHYDQIFDYWDNDEWKCPVWFKDQGCEVVPLERCAEEDASYWLAGRRGLFCKESADAARSIGKEVTPLRVKETP